MPPNDGTLVIENADLLPGSFRNFTGREGQYNREGDRNFTIRLEEELALQLLADGWNIKRLKNRETGEPKMGDYTLNISVGFKNRPPLLVLISSKGRVDLGQHECELLDWVDILKADVIVRPYHWDVQGSQGIKAYVKSLFITLNEDYLELKYADVPMMELNAAEQHDNNAKAVEATSQMLQVESGQNQTPNLDEEPAWPEDDIVDAELVED